MIKKQYGDFTFYITDNEECATIYKDNINRIKNKYKRKLYVFLTISAILMFLGWYFVNFVVAGVLYYFCIITYSKITEQKELDIKNVKDVWMYKKNENDEWIYFLEFRKQHPEEVKPYIEEIRKENEQEYYDSFRRAAIDQMILGVYR